jgi:hypothetical protein
LLAFRIATTFKPRSSASINAFAIAFDVKRVRLHVHGLLRVTQLVHDGIRAVIKINSIPQLIPLAEISYFL